jgi:hypothetical protein
MYRLQSGVSGMPHPVALTAPLAVLQERAGDTCREMSTHAGEVPVVPAADQSLAGDIACCRWPQTVSTRCSRLPARLLWVSPEAAVAAVPGRTASMLRGTSEICNTRPWFAWLNCRAALISTQATGQSSPGQVTLSQTTRLECCTTW